MHFNPFECSITNSPPDQHTATGSVAVCWCQPAVPDDLCVITLPLTPPTFCVLRDKEHSTIVYEGPPDTPLLRLGWNKQDPRYIAALLADSTKVCVRVCVNLCVILRRWFSRGKHSGCVTRRVHVSKSLGKISFVHRSATQHSHHTCPRHTATDIHHLSLSLPPSQKKSNNNKYHYYYCYNNCGTCKCRSSYWTFGTPRRRWRSSRATRHASMHSRGRRTAHVTSVLLVMTARCET